MAATYPARGAKIRKVRLYLFDETNGEPLPGIPIELKLCLDRKNQSSNPLSFGLLVSNHVGYASFALGAESQFTEQGVLWLEVPHANSYRIELPFEPVSHDYYAAVRLERVIPIALPSNVRSFGGSSKALDSIQYPDVDDWVLSPGTFGNDSLASVGEDGCETLLPSRVADRIVRFHRLVRDADMDELRADFAPDDCYETRENPEFGWRSHICIRTGELRHYQLIWRPLTHALGKVLYALTLAPCEVVRMAVVDWARTDAGTRTEQSRLSDSLHHRLQRDRTIEEVVNAVLWERQSGESFLGGLAGVGGYGGGFGGGSEGVPQTPAPSDSGATGPSAGAPSSAGQNWGITGSHALGYAIANTGGNREVDVNSTQTLLEEVLQASHLVRDLRSTVVVQAEQTEREAVQTRIIRNHNHSHALTILYYEVVRHYLLSFVRARSDKALFLKYPLRRFGYDLNTADFIRKRRTVLSQSLRDSARQQGFSALDEIVSETLPGSSELPGAKIRVTGLVVVFKTGSDTSSNDRHRLVIVTDKGRVILKSLHHHYGIVPHYFNHNEASGGSAFINELFDTEASNTFFIDMTRATITDQRSARRVLHGRPLTVFGDEQISPLEISRIGFAFNEDNNDPTWDFNGLEIYAAVEHDQNSSRPSQLIKIIDTRSSGEAPRKVVGHGDWLWDVDPNFHLMQTNLERRVAKAKALITHLNDHVLFYNASVWLNEDPQERASRFNDYRIGGTRLIDLIENRPIEVFGDYVAFRMQTVPNDQSSEPEVLGREIVSLPTRGAFAEAKLSNCNASEKIDDTRFWDWQISPCRDDATQIAAVTLGSRRANVSLDPSSLPDSGVAITSPAEAPEPFGLREVMQLLRTPNIFDNLSGLNQLGDLLGKLVEAAAEVEKARVGASVQGGRSAAGTPASAETLTPASRPIPQADQGSSSPQQTTRQLANAERQISRVSDPERREALRDAAAQAAVEGVDSNPSAVPGRRRPEQLLQIVFRDHRRVPISGAYDVQVWESIDLSRSGMRSGGTSQHHRVTVAIPQNWQEITIELMVRSVRVPVLGRGDFAHLQAFVDGTVGRFIGTSEDRLFSGQLFVEDRTVDQGRGASYMMDAIFTTRERTLPITTQAELEGALEGGLQAGIVEISRNLGGSIGGGISIPVTLVQLDGGIRLDQH